MSGSLRLNGSTSGFSEITAPDVAGDQTFTLPAVGGTLPVYQQGGWAPRWVLGVTPGSYVSTEGRWSRVGNTVTIFGRIQGSGGGTDANSIRLGKLPYKQAPGTGEGAVTVGYPGGLFGSPAYPFWCLITAGQDYFQFFTNSGGQLIGNDLAAINNTFHFSGSYLTDDTTFVPINGATIS